MPRPYRDAVPADSQDWRIPQRFHHIRPLRGHLLLKEKAGGALHLLPSEEGSCQPEGMTEG